MATFPGGIFTIVNDDTGLAVRTVLGASKRAWTSEELDPNYPFMEDWSGKRSQFQTVTAKPGLELGPANGSPETAWTFTGNKDGGKIVSYPVSEYQNIGDYCVWMNEPSADTAGALENSMERLKLLNGMSADLKKKLDPLVQSAYELMTGDPQHGLQKDLSAEDFAQTWNLLCAFHGKSTFKGLQGDAADAAETYLDAVAKEGVRLPAPSSVQGVTYLYGTGAERGDSSYWWVYDGTYIYSADHRCKEPELTYWTDVDGSLVGKAKRKTAKGSGQTWTAVRWTPPTS